MDVASVRAITHAADLAFEFVDARACVVADRIRRADDALSISIDITWDSRATHSHQYTRALGLMYSTSSVSVYSCTGR